MRYRADIAAGSLKVHESRIVADLLLKDIDEKGWKRALLEDNVLQARSPATPRSSVFQILAQAGYIESTRSKKLQTVRIAKEVLDCLEARGLLERSIQMQEQEGDEALVKALASPLKPEKLVRIFEGAARSVASGHRVRIR